MTNQPPPLVGYDAYAADPALSAAVSSYGAEASAPALHDLGRLAGSEQARHWADQADRHPPVLRTHDRFGHRIDEVEFHPAYHRLMDVAVGNGLHAAAWTSNEKAAHVVRAAGFVVWSQVEAAHGCPVSMTYAAVPALQIDPALADVWVPRLTSTTYDFGLRPPGSKLGCLAGMGMTEKQGGSDVRANTTRAEPLSDGWWALSGHKWFTSAPMNDVFLVLAQAPAGLTCFVVPRVFDDGTRNEFRLQRLKDKLGNRANASAEIELDQTLALRLGEEGRGVATIIEMVAATRLDCVLGSAALLRRAAVEAVWHTAHRSAFGRPLVDQPLMRSVLADLVLESEAATALGMRLAATFDAGDDPVESALRRIGLPLAKFWVCKRTPSAVGEALECLGGNGYVEESGMPRLYREAPLNSIWEGSGNIQALDLLRVLTRSPEAFAAWHAEVKDVQGVTSAYESTLDEVERLRASVGEAGARRLAGLMAVLWQAALLLRYAPTPVAEAFCASRLPAPQATYGMLPAGLDVDAILARADARAATVS